MGFEPGRQENRRSPTIDKRYRVFLLSLPSGLQYGIRIFPLLSDKPQFLSSSTERPFSTPQRPDVAANFERQALDRKDIEGLRFEEN